jgi:hypothetical protein
MTPIFEREPHPKAYYLWPRDAHTNAAGHLEMAKALTELICSAVRTVASACHARPAHNAPAGSGLP